MDTFVGRCHHANRSHYALRATPFGNKCIEMPAVYVLFFQLTKSGPLATQQFPLSFLLLSSHDA